MVNAGELEVIGTLEDSEIDSGFDRVGNNFNDLENQANQTNVSLGRLDDTSNKIFKSFMGLGVAGVTAMTALATKSPVLAGSIAKIEVETLKLSNTIGKQMKPLFEEVGQNLIPSINEAFADGDDVMDIFIGKTTDLVSALSSLIRLDWESLLDSLESYFNITGETPEEREETQKEFGQFSEFETSYGLGKDIWSDIKSGEGHKAFGKGMVLPVATFIDFVQYLMGANNEKEMKFATSNGLTR